MQKLNPPLQKGVVTSKLFPWLLNNMTRHYMLCLWLPVHQCTTYCMLTRWNALPVINILCLVWVYKWYRPQILWAPIGQPSYYLALMCPRCLSRVLQCSLPGFDRCCANTCARFARSGANFIIRWYITLTTIEQYSIIFTGSLWFFLRNLFGY